MFLSTILCVYILLFGQGVTSRGLEDNISQHNVNRSTRQAYQYNHPPAFESSQPIPVAIVYDEESVREGKSLRETNKDNRLQKTQTSTLPSRRRNPNPKGTQLKNKPESELQIPVAVVYDEVPVLTKQNNEKNIKFGAREQTQRSRQRNTTKKDNEKTLTSEPQTERASKGEKSKRKQRPVVPIIGSENHVYSHTGEFNYSYEGGDGTRAFETGKLKSYNDETTGEAVKGGFSYTDKDGNDFSLSYTADENGYRPTGAHLPTPPPIPPAIARALRFLATKTTPETVTESIIPL